MGSLIDYMRLRGGYIITELVFVIFLQCKNDSNNLLLGKTLAYEAISV